MTSLVHQQLVFLVDDVTMPLDSHLHCSTTVVCLFASLSYMVLQLKEGISWHSMHPSPVPALTPTLSSPNSAAIFLKHSHNL
jgi:hypothetical protein